MTPEHRYAFPGRRAGVAVAAVLAVATVGLAGGASAQPIIGQARWCVTMSHFGGTLDCNYHSLAQCMAAAAGVSNQCSLNSWYVERPAPRRRPARRRAP